MIFTGTAAELAELTRKWWGAEWWPAGLEYAQCDYTDGDDAGPSLWCLEVGGISAVDDDPAETWKGDPDPETCDTSASSILPHQAAAMMVFACAIAWMAEKGAAPLVAKPGTYNCSVIASMGGGSHGRSNNFGPSPLHAVLAAVGACK